MRGLSGRCYVRATHCSMLPRLGLTLEPQGTWPGLQVSQQRARFGERSLLKLPPIGQRRHHDNPKVDCQDSFQKCSRHGALNAHPGFGFRFPK